MTETSSSKQTRFGAGNKASLGRPRKTASLDEMLATAASAIAEKVIEKALAGDMAAAAIVLGMKKGTFR